MELNYDGCDHMRKNTVNAQAPQISYRTRYLSQATPKAQSKQTLISTVLWKHTFQYDYK